MILIVFVVVIVVVVVGGFALDIVLQLYDINRVRVEQAFNKNSTSCQPYGAVGAVEVKGAQAHRPGPSSKNCNLKR
jgi:hypothetical protein